MKHNSKYLLLAMGLGLLSCEKAPVNPASSQKANTSSALYEGTSTANGRLVFESEDQFLETMKGLQALDHQSLVKWDSENGVTSLVEHYKEFDMEEREEGTVQYLISQGKLLGVPDEKFAAVLNADGVFQVGQEIHKVNQYEELIFPAEREDILIKHSWNDPEVKHIPIEFKYVSEDAKSEIVKEPSTAQRTGNFYGWYTRNVYSDVNNRAMPKTWNSRETRMVAEQWNVTYAVYASHGVRTKYEYRSRFAGWLCNDASYLAVEGNSRVRGTGQPFAIPVSGSSNDSNTSSTSKTLAWLGGLGVAFTIEESNSTHTAVYKGATARTSL
ncbi:hypothetical protein [Hymenobacter elongatus]|uniref:DUF4848 domain-containing protein n=1 Tax=Hymenobacter elongatus TaxID=877208 RepID=A0A4Z0PGY9_9BACT|nr:hypothetical protein [Hymenobacter elongatus]TGE14086.1 hypothetical protein E5J99_17690 [Hymenobacter elongatus]